MFSAEAKNKQTTSFFIKTVAQTLGSTKSRDVSQTLSKI